MKKIVLTLALMIATLTVAAENILYFTYNQAARTVACLNNQDELMIYCGYEDELPTYVLINEVWAEQISSSFYEIWLYGYDAYTGEEVYMPIDLECIYLMQNRNIYSAAQYLRFKYTHRRPTFAACGLLLHLSLRHPPSGLALSQLPAHALPPLLPPSPALSRSHAAQAFHPWREPPRLHRES